jgi:putative Mg2+ transporter-C (MgtC) family protein
VDLHLILAHLTDIAVAYGLSLPIGWDREQSERSAGLRTFPLVAIASCGFILASEQILVDQPDARSRVIQGVVTGIGFIGGGAVLKHGEAVRGTATAASLWATGAIGVAAGLRNYEVALVLSIVTFLTLRLLAPWRTRIAALRGDQDQDGKPS